MQTGVVEAEPGEEIETAAWRVLESAAPSLRKWTKTGRRAASRLLEQWAAKRFVYEHVALESNMLDALVISCMLLESDYNR